MDSVRKGSRKVVIYEHPDGVIFIQATTRLPNGRHRVKEDNDSIVYANIKDTPEVLGRKVMEILEKCD